MKRAEKPLCELSCSENGKITGISGEKSLCRRFADLGCLVGSEVRKLGVAPLGDPSAYLICGTVIAIRKKDASLIRVMTFDE